MHYPYGVKGFTLIELMITVGIIVILAAIALPSYYDYVIRANLIEGTNQLAAYRAQMEQYYQDARTYATSGNYTTPCPTNYTPTNSNWTYDCSFNPPTASTYYIQAAGVNGTPAAGFTYYIDYTNTQKTLLTPAGWTSSNSKWCLNKGCY